MKSGIDLRGAVSSKPRHRAWFAPAFCAALMWACMGGAHAASIYKCVDARGHLTYQDTPCPARAHQRKVELQPLPTLGDAAEVAAARHRSGTASHPRASRTVRRAQGTRASPHRAVTKTQTSWECRAADGEVFYRHSHCPGSVPGDGVVRWHDGGDPASGKRSHRRRNAWSATPVHGVQVPRAEACRRIHAAGAAARDGHARDETVSTYDHLMGRDPCGGT